MPTHKECVQRKFLEGFTRKYGAGIFQSGSGGEQGPWVSQSSLEVMCISYSPRPDCFYKNVTLGIMEPQTARWVVPPRGPWRTGVTVVLLCVHLFVWWASFSRSFSASEAPSKGSVAFSPSQLPSGKAEPQTPICPSIQPSGSSTFLVKPQNSTHELHPVASSGRDVPGTLFAAGVLVGPVGARQGSLGTADLVCTAS